LIARLDDGTPVNTVTGQVMQEKNIICDIGDFIKVFKPQEVGRKAKFVKQFTSRDQKRTLNKLTTEERAFLYSIQFYLQWDTNVIADDEGNPLTWADIEKIAHISRPTRYKLIASLESKNAIRYVARPDGKNIGIMMNPTFAYNGKQPSASLKKLFTADNDVFGG